MKVLLCVYCRKYIEVVYTLQETSYEQVPSTFSPEDVREKLKRSPGGPTQPLTVHLRQEIDRLNTIIALTTVTLKDLRLAIAGTSCTVSLFGMLLHTKMGMRNVRH